MLREEHTLIHATAASSRAATIERVRVAPLVLFVLTAASCGTRRSPFEGEPPLVAAPDGGGCTGRSCKRGACTTGQPTRISGRVTEPAGARGLYNVAVYVPNGDVTPLPRGASCNACAKRNVGAAVSTLTDARGEFVLEDVPADTAVPIVIEIGRFRRVVTRDVVACESVRLGDGDTRLPRSSIEGDIPDIAVTTGAADALECLLRGIGIDEREFVGGDDPTGHVHVYRGKGGGGIGLSGAPAEDLWNDANRLSRHDVVLLSCEGNPAIETKDPAPLTSYLEAGGHVLATHYHSTWLERSPNPDLRNLATWQPIEDVGTDYDIDTSFPKGAAFADWLVAVGASASRGTIRLDNVTASVASLREPPAQGWVRRSSNAARYFSINTPVFAEREEQCGRFVFSDIHAFGKGGSDFPVGCPPTSEPLSPQQLALEYLLFDLFSCVDDDRAAPLPPR